MPHRINLPNHHPHHQQLTETLNSFAAQYDVLRVFLSYSQASQKHLLIIHIGNLRVPETLSESKWIRKALEHYHTQVIILGSVDIRRHLKLGSLWINRHCNGSSFIFKKEGHEWTYPNLDKQLKKHQRFREDYFRQRDLLSTEIQRAKNNNALTMAYHLYISLFEHHLLHLELLCTGRYFYQDHLNERFLRLEKYLPEIKRMMLKKTGTRYYLIEALFSAIKADEEQEPMMLEEEFEGAISTFEEQLYGLVQRTFNETKKAVKPMIGSETGIPEKVPASPCEPVISILTQHYAIDEIFLFHQEEISESDRGTTVLYLLLISNRISHQDLCNMMQMVLQQTEGRFSIVPIAHSKTWIQEHLCEYQRFFQKIMTPQNAIFLADVPSVIHWHTEAMIIVAETIYDRSCLQLYENYRAFRSREGQGTHEGLGLMISGLFYRACTMLIHSSLHYRPNPINIRILWKLCQYAEPKVKLLDFLIQKLPFDFFEFLNPSKNLFKNFCRLEEEELCILDELAQSFFALLDR
ncbi:hypothetical protein [Chryseobacterium sp. R2A-55]|uniref:hypothetical protein n=1 Tax=Chryseobacterium sp. R2A-55 TaxID=2744445 RepID=UPI001F243181|nr:hypothetical protein [Chryseobacterium sp. R2A-55]